MGETWAIREGKEQGNGAWSHSGCGDLEVSGYTPTCRFSSPKTNSFLVVTETITRYSLGAKEQGQE